MASLVVSGVFALAMIVAAARAAVVLPAGARIPLHYGSLERCLEVPKRAGLVIWPAAGLAVAGVLGGVAASGLAADWVPGVRYVLAPAATGVLLAFEVGALLARERETRFVRDNGAVARGRPHEDRQQSGQGNAGPAAR
jgi:hypothetical protein